MNTASRVKLMSVIIILVFLVTGCANNNSIDIRDEEKVSNFIYEQLDNYVDNTKSAAEIIRREYTKEDIMNWEKVYLDITSDGYDDVIYIPPETEEEIRLLTTVVTLDRNKGKLEKIRTYISRDDFKVEPYVKDGFLVITRDGTYKPGIVIYSYVPELNYLKDILWLKEGTVIDGDLNEFIATKSQGNGSEAKTKYTFNIKKNKYEEEEIR